MVSSTLPPLTVMDFLHRYYHLKQKQQSILCIGLDPDPARFPVILQDLPLEKRLLTFNRAIIEATLPHAIAFKLNLAFYERYGMMGWKVLTETLAAIPRTHLTILDAKRGDIGNSARFYAEALFDQLQGDACTVHPYMGQDSIEPFLQWPERATFVLALTSNPGSKDLQQLAIHGEPVYIHIGKKVAEWEKNEPGIGGLVAGATHSEALQNLHLAVPDALPFLVPGIGAQGGDPSVVRRIATQRPVIVNSSRAILYASNNTDFAEAAATQARLLQQELYA